MEDEKELIIEEKKDNDVIIGKVGKTIFYILSILLIIFYVIDCVIVIQG